MALVAAGALIGAISVGGAYLFGATLVASMLAGAAIGSLFEMANIDLEFQSPTYSFGPTSNSKTQVLPIPVVYGTMRVAGNIFYENFLDDKKTKVERMVGVSEGPVQSITGVQFDDQNPKNLDECSYTVHLDSDDSTTDPRDPGGYAPEFPDLWPKWLPPLPEWLKIKFLAPSPKRNVRPYPNHLAFIGATLKAQEKLTGPAVITSIVEGRKIWTPSGVQFSDNPAWIVRDLLTNTRYGLGIPESRIDADSFLTAATYCDGLVDGGKRFTLNYVVDTQKEAVDVLAEMLACFRGYLIRRDKIALKIDAPVASVYKQVTEDSIIAGSFTWWQTPEDEAFNRVIVEWVDPGNHWETVTVVYEDTDDIEHRGVIERSFSLKGITNVNQACRMGAYLLDTARLVRNHCSFKLSLGDADIEAGDVIGITHSLAGWVQKPFRVTQVVDSGDRNAEEISVVCSEYVAEVYNDRAEPISYHVDTNLDNPFTCPDVTGLNAVENVLVLMDGTVSSDIDITWTPPNVPLTGIEVSILEQGQSQYRVLALLPPGSTGYVARNIPADQSVTVKVVCIDDDGIRSTGATKGLTLYGKALPPGNPSNLSVIPGPGLVRIQWTNPSDQDLRYVEIVEYQGVVQPSSPNQGTLVACIAGTSLTRGGLEESTVYWYWVRAVDTSGNVSSWVGPISATTESFGVGPGSITETEIADDAISTPKLKANCVTAEKISVNALSAIKADLGTVTAGVAKSSDGKFEINLTDKTLKIYDENNVLRVHLGYLG